MCAESRNFVRHEQCFRLHRDTVVSQCHAWTPSLGSSGARNAAASSPLAHMIRGAHAGAGAATDVPIDRHLLLLLDCISLQARRSFQRIPVAINHPDRQSRHPTQRIAPSVPSAVIERCFVEVRRRTRPMVCFVNVQSVDRIIYSIFHRFNLDWKTRTLKLITQAA